MCVYQIADVECGMVNCHEVLSPKGYRKAVVCSTVSDNPTLGFGGCGSTTQEEKIQPQKAINTICVHCTRGAREEHQEMYENIGEYLAEQRETQSRLDGQRRYGHEGARSATPRPQEQSNLVAGAGGGWPAGQGGFDLGGPERPQDLTFDWLNSSQGHAEDNGQGAQDGSHQRGGQGSGQGNGGRSHR